MKLNLFNKPVATSALIIGLILGLTPLYAYGVALILLAFALIIPVYNKGYFSSAGTRLASLFLAFAAWTMTLATFAWVAKLSLHSSVYIISFVAAYLALYNLLPITKNKNSSAPVPKRTLLSVILSAAGLLIMGASFYISDPELASNIQIITNGYDNSAHMSMIQTTYEANGYVYGPYDEIKDRISWKTLTAYPQGWHFVNAYLWKGTGLSFFGANSVPTDVNFYVFTVFAWYFMALFMLHQLLWSVSARVISKKYQIAQAAAVIMSSLLIQLLVFWGSLQFGFATFIGAFAFTFLLVAILVELPTQVSKKSEVNPLLASLALSVLLVAAVAQGWLFASPVVGVVMVAFYLPIAIHVIRKKLITIKQFLVALGASLLAFAPIAIQLFINMRFSTQGTNQINDDGGIFGISTTLAAIIITLVITVISSNAVKDKPMAIKLTKIILPPLLFTFVLFAYQLLTLGHPAYFFTKLLAFTLALVWIPLTYLVVSIAQTMSRNLGQVGATGALAVLFLLLPLMFGQNIESFTNLLQRNSNLSAEAADDIADIAENGTLRSKKTFVFTGEDIDGDTIGTIFTSTMSETKSRCDGVGWLISKGQNEKLPEFLNPCAESEEIQVITSDLIKKDILDKLDPKIVIIK